MRSPKGFGTLPEVMMQKYHQTKLQRHNLHRKLAMLVQRLEYYCLPAERSRTVARVETACRIRNELSVTIATTETIEIKQHGPYCNFY